MRILLDTSLVLELLREPRHQPLDAWFREQHGEGLCIAAPTLAELLLRASVGITAEARAADAARIDAFVIDELGGRVLAFEAKAARRYADLCRDVAPNVHRVGPTPFQVKAVAMAQEQPAAVATTRPQLYYGMDTDVPLIDLGDAFGAPSSELLTALADAEASSEHGGYLEGPEAMDALIQELQRRPAAE